MPVHFWIWLFGALVSLLGDLTMTFGIGWAASHYGGSTAGLVLLLAAAPRAVLLLIGGAIGDRYGPHRVLLAACTAMFGVTAALVPITSSYGEPVWLLLCTALVVGCIDAFFLPSSRAMPRLLVPTQLVPRALASYQAVGAIFAVTGTAVGGLLVGWQGFRAAAGFDALTFAVMIGALLLLRKVLRRPGGETRTGMFRSLGAGLKMAFGQPLTRALLIVMTVVAGLLMPMDALLLPLLARHHGMTPATAGLLVACRSVGVGLIAMRILFKGAFPRPGMVMAIGLLVASIGLGGLSWAPNTPATMALAVLSGIGTGLFTGHILPLLMNSMPKEYQSRLQSIVVLCQSLAVTVMNPVLGGLSDVNAIQITGVFLGIGAGAALTGLIALTRPVVRAASV